MPRQHGENRALYLKKLFHWGSKNFGIKIKVFGSEKLAKPSLVVSSHISWLEIWDSLYLWDLHYISKEEVKHFPIIGKLAKTMGSIFIARSKTKRCVEGIKQVSHYLLQGENVMLYPEGTTSDGTKVLPFKATYFSAALKAQVPVQPIAVFYRNFDGTQNTEVAYWGEINLIQSAWKVAKTRGVTLEFYVLEPIEPGFSGNERYDRALLAQKARLAISKCLEKIR